MLFAEKCEQKRLLGGKGYRFHSLFVDWDALAVGHRHLVGIGKSVFALDSVQKNAREPFWRCDEISPKTFPVLVSRADSWTR